jgi:cell cycle sensor histidine kinase DivJ
VALDAAARSVLAPAHALFLFCAASPLIIDRVAVERLPASAAGAVAGIAWALGGATLALTAGGADIGFYGWFVLPAAFAALDRRPGQVAGEAAALGLLGALAVGLVRLAGVSPLGWDYGALPVVTAFAAVAAAALAAARVERARRRAASRTAVETRRLAAVVAASPDIFLTVDHTDRIVAARGGGDGKLTEDASVYVGQPAADLFAELEAQRFARALDRVRRFGDPERLVLAGEQALVEARITLTDGGELTLALRPASPEVEALPKAERERDAADAAARARSRFFASMSHELRTPLNAVLGFSDAMRLRMFGPLPAKYAEYAEDIHNSAKHLLDLVGDLLDVSKIEAGRYELEFTRFDAREAAEGAARMMRPAAEAGQVRFELDAGDAPIEVEADLRALKQMLLNLTSNAVKFSGAKGVVKLSMGVEDGMLVAAVSDTGPGLSSDEISRLARPFEQTREGRLHASRSSGLGLALVKSLCELHGGRLEIESEPGRGAVFRMRLPVLAKDGEPSDGMDARGRLQRVRDAGFAGDAAGEA